METADDGDPGAGRVGRPRLPTDSIVVAALEIIDEAGGEALSMRSLAQRLNSSTATLYRHFPNRAVLMVAVIDRILGEIDLDATVSGPGEWRGAMRMVAGEYFSALTRHPGVARLLTDHTPTGPNAMRLREVWLDAMLRNGFPLGLAVRAGALMASYVQGFAIQHTGRRATVGVDDEVLVAVVGRPDMADFPNLTAAISAGLAPVALEDEFTFGFELILDGLGGALDGARQAGVR